MRLIHALTRTAGLVLLGAAPLAMAQVTAHTLADVGPLPAEDRDSMGAVLLETSPVPAQRELVRQQIAQRVRLQDIGVRDAGPARLLQVSDPARQPRMTEVPGTGFEPR